MFIYIIMDKIIHKTVFGKLFFLIQTFIIKYLHQFIYIIQIIFINKVLNVIFGLIIWKEILHLVI